MKKIVTSALSVLLATTFVLEGVSVVSHTDVRADEQKINLDGRFYVFNNKSEYEIDSNVSVCSTKEASASLGFLNLQGDFVKEYEKDGKPAFEVTDGTVFSFSYIYKNALKYAPDEEWHIVEDDEKVINGVDLGEKIQDGAFLFQTSFDGVKWVTSKVVTDLSDSVKVEAYDGINDIQLENGCYYRIIVAYELKKLVDESSFWVVDTSDYEYKKCAEFYQFYASYNRPSEPETGKKKFFESTIYSRQTKKNNYVGDTSIDSNDDPHYGWNLGTFCLSGFTDSIDDVYFKRLSKERNIYSLLAIMVRRQ